MMKISILLPTIRSDKKLLDSIRSLSLGELSGYELLIGYDRVNKVDVENLLLELNGTVNYQLISGDGSLAATLNKLVKVSSGEYIARADDDDLYINNRLKFQSYYLDTRKKIDVVGTDIYLARESKIFSLSCYQTNHHNITYSALFNNYIFAHPVVMGRRSFFEENSYDQNSSAEDYDLWVRGIVRGAKYANIPLPMMVYNVPSYSEDKKDRLSNNSEQIINYLLLNYFNIPENHSCNLAKIFNVQNQDLNINSEVWKSINLFDRVLVENFGSSADFFQVMSEKAPHLYKKINAVLGKLN